MSRITQRGDTIIEVLLAVTVFSLVAVGVMAVMNKGTSSAERALEVTLVKQQIDSQVDALKAAQQDFFAIKGNSDLTSSDQSNTWKKITSDEMGTNDITVSNNKCPTEFGDNFAMNGRTAIDSRQFLSADDETPPYAQVIYRSIDPKTADDNQIEGIYGIWISRQLAQNFTPKAYDFTVHACWYGPGTDVPMQLQTVVRLYDAT